MVYKKGCNAILKYKNTLCIKYAAANILQQHIASGIRESRSENFMLI